MKVSYVLLISLLIVGALFVPAVSADVIIDEEIVEYEFTGGSRKIEKSIVYPSTAPVSRIYLKTIQNHPELLYIIIDVEGGASALDDTPVNYTINGQTHTARRYISHYRNFAGVITSSRVSVYFDGDWDIGDLTGTQYIQFSETLFTGKGHQNCGSPVESDLAWVWGGSQTNLYRYEITVSSVKPWYNHLTIREDLADLYHLHLKRDYGTIYPSQIDLYNGSELHFSNAASTDFDYRFPKSSVNQITLNSGINLYTWSLDTSGTDPDPGETSTLRTGTVTMTDHNGTSISGFEVTAVNHYTGESFTVATDTDVAVMNLPMDRTTQIRNPQTGVYEESPVGYYRFFGQSSGYKMLNEDGIQVAVMPEQYGSYKLCDIGVTSETGYLTGQHKFQIRSRSDNTVLQTGTISAKSATTGEWYNATVSGGLASLILPYDTSNSQSQYAGNYYVYATSPGYEDSDYGTQIIVMPHTVSEIKTILLTPIGGVPTPGNVTLRIQAFSETGPGVVNAEIFIAGVLGAGASLWDTYTASSTGYLTVSVPGNSTYDIVARGAGYYDSARRVEVFTEDPPLIEMRLYLSGAPTVEPTDEPTGWPTGPPPTQPPGGIPDDDDDSDGFLVQAVRGIGLAFGVGFSTAKIIFGMLLALAIGFTTAKQLRGGAAEFGVGLLGGTMLGVLIGLLPVWIIVVLLLVVGLYIGNRYVGGSNNG